MSANQTSVNIRGDFEQIAKELGLATSLIDPVADCIVRREVMPSQIPFLLTSSLSWLATVRDDLESLSDRLTTDMPICDKVRGIVSAINTGEGFSFHEMENQLSSMARDCTDIPSVLAPVQQCHALFCAVKLDYLKAVQLCKESADFQELSLQDKWNLIYLQAIFLGEHGREFNDDKSLQDSIDLLRSTVIPFAQENAGAEERYKSFEALGNVLGIIGQRRRGTRYLEEAIDMFRQACDQCDKQKLPENWSAAQNGLGNALGVLGQRKADDELLKNAVEAFELALTQRDEYTTPNEWASTKNNLAAVLQSLGRKENDPRVLKRASLAYKDVLRVWTRSLVPVQWSTTMDNLGTVLRHLGEHRRGPRTLMQAVAAYKSALSERPRDSFSSEWAITQNNLGAALHKLALREQDPETMQKAVEAYECALEEYTFENSQKIWAMTVANLGVARREYAGMTEDAAAASKAVMEIESAVEVFRNASHAQYTELGEEQLAWARHLRDSLVPN